MDDEQKAVNDVPVADSTESPAVEPAAPETPPAEEEKTESEVTESKEVKPVEKRIHKLVDERDREKAKAESLAKQVEELTAQISGQPQGVYPQQPIVEPGAEVTPEQYKEDIVRQAQAITQLEIQKERMINRVNQEAIESMRNHPELDPDSDVFDKELSDMVVESVKSQILSNPNASPKKLINKIMQPYRKAIEQKVAATTETITKQVSESAARPTQVKVVEKPFDQLSEREMEEKLGSVW